MCSLALIRGTFQKSSTDARFLAQTCQRLERTFVGKRSRRTTRATRASRTSSRARYFSPKVTRRRGAFRAHVERRRTTTRRARGAHVARVVIVVYHHLSLYLTPFRFCRGNENRQSTADARAPRIADDFADDFAATRTSARSNARTSATRRLRGLPIDVSYVRDAISIAPRDESSPSSRTSTSPSPRGRGPRAPLGGRRRCPLARFKNAPET